MLANKLPKCRFGCHNVVLLVELDEGCFCFPNDKKQWLCMQHFVKLEQSYRVIADVISLGWVNP